MNSRNPAELRRLHAAYAEVHRIDRLSRRTVEVSALVDLDNRFTRDDGEPACGVDREPGDGT